jgi:spore germination protein KB
MERISNHQLFMLVCLFEIGSTIIFGFASAAGRAAWISVLISTSIGVFINIIYYSLMKMNPGLTLIEWYPAQLGRWIGIPIAWIYALEFIYDGGRGLADLKILIPSTILPKTPILIIELTFILLTVYALFSGIESIARLGEIFLPLLLLVYFAQFILMFSSEIIHPQYIKPILDKGWKNIFAAVFPLGITQSFGQTIEFAMIWPLIKESDKILKTTVFATILSGIFIAALDILSVLALGATSFSHSLFPVYRLVRLISVGDFLENIEAINVIFFLTTAFFKLFIHLYCAIRAIQLLTYSKSSRIFVLPVAAIVLFLGMNMASNTA